MSKYKLNFKLKQHTPIIHFQHDQEGATLRASELKPKLDKFLIKKLALTKEIEKNGEQIIVPKKEYEHWFNNKEKLSLDYKVGIEAKERRMELNNLIKLEIKTKRNNRTGENEVPTNLPGFFGNMMKIEEFVSGKKNPKKVTFYSDISIYFTSFTPTINNRILIEVIKEYFAEFLATTNFGTRQSKGFGSFYIHPEGEHYQEINNEWFDYKTSIKLYAKKDKEKYKELFQTIEWFYKALRSGINHKRPAYEYINGKRQIKKDKNGLMVMEDLFYMKPLIFLYFLERDTQWEKKTIKEKFFNDDLKYSNGNIKYYGLKTQTNTRPMSDVLKASFPKEKIIKDLLGLSSEESWKSYNAIIVKAQSETDDSGHVIYENEIPNDLKKKEIERFQSPLLIVPIETKDGFTIFFKFKEGVSIQGKWFNIKNSKNSHNKPFTLQVAEDFSLNKFFEYLSDGSFKITDHFKIYNSGASTEIISTLTETFSSLSKTKKP